MRVSRLFFLSLSSCLPFLSLYVDAKVDPGPTSAVQSNWTANLANNPLRLSLSAPRLSTASAQRNLSLYENETVGGWVGVLCDFVFCLSDAMPCSLLVFPFAYRRKRFVVCLNEMQQQKSKNKMILPVFVSIIKTNTNRHKYRYKIYYYPYAAIVTIAPEHHQSSPIFRSVPHNHRPVPSRLVSFRSLI
jgi:hypothetical protein